MDGQVFHLSAQPALCLRAPPLLIHMQMRQLHLLGQGGYRQVVHEPIRGSGGCGDDEEGGEEGADDPQPASAAGSSGQALLRPFCFLLQNMRVSYDLSPA